MTNLRSNFTSTGEKLLLWPEILYKLRKQRLPTPINIQISPTNACNINCWYCSVANRDQGLELPLDKILNFISQLSISGTVKAVEITGGGEPSVYSKINELIAELSKRQLSIGLISNGFKLCDLIQEKNLRKLSWIRLSMNTLEDTGQIQIPLVSEPMLGFSYVWGKPKTDGIAFLSKLKNLAKKHKVGYIRLVPNCLEDVTLVRNKLAKVATSLGSLVFFQEKMPRKPNQCYWGFVKPYLYSDGLVYPCNSVSLPSEANLDFPKEIAMFSMKEASKWMLTKINSGCINISKWTFCNSCRFSSQNDLLSTILKTNFKHKEHI